MSKSKTKPPRDSEGDTMSNRGEWIQTYTGRQFWPLEPRVEDIDICDIAHALSMKCRYAGHVLEFYSVAQHSVIVSQIVPPEDALWGLLHDAAEAYLPDVCRPIKKSLTGFKALEDGLLVVIAQAFDLPAKMPESIHAADLTMLATEQRDLMAPPPIPWGSIAGVTPLPEVIKPDEPAWAKEAFMRRFTALARRRKGPTRWTPKTTGAWKRPDGPRDETQHSPPPVLHWRGNEPRPV